MGASDTAFVDLGLLPRDPIAGATGLWAQTIGGAGRFAAPGGPQDTVPIEGNLVAADERAVYASRDTPVADADNLWRYPLDGSAGEPIAGGTTVAGIAGGLPLKYPGLRMLARAGRVVTLWLASSSAASSGSTLYVQTVVVP